MNELELNQIGEIDSIKVQCLPMNEADTEKWEEMTGGCCEFYGCAFYDSYKCVEQVIPCTPDERADKMKVYYKKTE